LKKKILFILTDSVALPKREAETIWEDTYIYKLRERYDKTHNIINVSIGGASIKDLRNQVNYYKILNPEIVILHCGIVDASPRAFGRIEMETIKKLRLFRLTKPFVSFLRKNRAHHYAKPILFKEHVKIIKKELNAEKFLLIGIIPASKKYEDKLPGISKSIIEYNNILKLEQGFICADSIPKEGISRDFHHINKIGQMFFLNKLIKVLDEESVFRP
jgi:hypothetical protein